MKVKIYMQDLTGDICNYFLSPSLVKRSGREQDLYDRRAQGVYFFRYLCEEETESMSMGIIKSHHFSDHKQPTAFHGFPNKIQMFPCLFLHHHHPLLTYWKFCETLPVTRHFSFFPLPYCLAFSFIISYTSNW